MYEGPLSLAGSAFGGGTSVGVGLAMPLVIEVLIDEGRCVPVANALDILVVELPVDVGDTVALEVPPVALGKSCPCLFST